MAAERGTLRRIFGKVAAVCAIAATLAFYALGIQIGHGYYQQWQANKAETVASQMVERDEFTKDLPWAAAGIAAVTAYGAGFAGIAAGKKKESYYGGYSSGYSSSNNDNFWLGYILGSNNGGSSSSGGSSNDKGGAALALVVVGVAAVAAGASVVSYKAAKGNFFTGEGPLFASKKEDINLQKEFRASIEDKPAAAPPAPVEPEVMNDPAPTVQPKWRPFTV